MVMLPSAFSLRQTSLKASLFFSESEMLVAFRLSHAISYCPFCTLSLLKKSCPIMSRACQQGQKRQDLYCYAYPVHPCIHPFGLILQTSDPAPDLPRCVRLEPCMIIFHMYLLRFLLIPLHLQL